MRLRILAAGALLAALSACATYGTQISQAQIDSIQAGETTKQQLLAEFGNPITQTRNSDGTEILGWSYASVGFAGTSYETQTLMITLDDSDVVTNYTVSDTTQP